MAPPKRGKIKAQIMEDVAEAIAFAASKAGEKLGLIKKQGNNSSAVPGDSASSSPPFSPNNNGV